MSLFGLAFIVCTLLPNSVGERYLLLSGFPTSHKLPYLVSVVKDDDHLSLQYSFLIWQYSNTIMISSACVSNNNTIIAETTSHAVSKAFVKYTENSALEQAACKVNTVVWKIFIWNYFIVGNIQEKNFHGFPVPTKIF